MDPDSDLRSLLGRDPSRPSIEEILGVSPQRPRQSLRDILNLNDPGMQETLHENRDRGGRFVETIVNILANFEYGSEGVDAMLGLFQSLNADFPPFLEQHTTEPILEILALMYATAAPMVQSSADFYRGGNGARADELLSEMRTFLAYASEKLRQHQDLGANSEYFRFVFQTLNAHEEENE
jgi:hypothetical protein